MTIPYGARLSTCALAVVLMVAAREARDLDLAFVQRDALFSEVAIQHLQDVVLHGGDWRASPLAWPLRDTVSQTDWMAGQALVGLPLRALALDPVRIYEIIGLLGLFATMLAADRLAAAMLGEGMHTWIAGVAGGLAPAHILHAQHVNLVWHPFGPIAALALVGGLRRDRPALAALGGASGVFAFHFGAYVGMHALAILCVTALFSAFYARGSRRTWAAAALGAVVAALTLVPVARVFLGASEAARFAMYELAQESIDLGRPSMPERDPLFQGVTSLVLLLVGMHAKRRAGWVWALAGVLLLAPIALALGPWIQWNGRPLIGPAPWGLALSAVPSLGSLRAPARWMAVSVLGAAPFVAAGAQRLHGWKPLLGPLALVGLVAELRPFDLGSLDTTAPGPAYALVEASTVPGPLFDKPGRGCREAGEARLRAALVHRRPLVGGRFARATHELQSVNRAIDGWPRPESVAWLQDNGVRLVFEHPPLSPPPPGATCEVSQDHRLCVLAPAP